MSSDAGRRTRLGKEGPRTHPSTMKMEPNLTRGLLPIPYIPRRREASRKKIEAFSETIYGRIRKCPEALSLSASFPAYLPERIETRVSDPVQGLSARL
ncbi:hypothetical protein HPP92_020013 [Vanilla planifolia]|uniref:Uncharacterized protein n=1 Tax=Vanilla planifolia TaxID=51239 RepID=A0A835UI32_VANPL|nr:hypothetical protein HPP92_020013 [Vanilla planifolia]